MTGNSRGTKHGRNSCIDKRVEKASAMHAWRLEKWMPTTKKIGYARVSTTEQHLDLQLAALASYGCSITFSDRGTSGTCFDRPGLRKALRAAQAGTTLVVWRLDRLGRSLRHLATIISDLEGRNVRVVSITECIDTRSTTADLPFICWPRWRSLSAL